MCDTSIPGDISSDQLSSIVAVQHQLHDILSKASTSRDRVDGICQLIEKVIQETVASVMLLNDKHHLYVFSAPNMPTDLVQKLNHLELGPDEGAWGNAIHRQAPVFVADAKADLRCVDLRTLLLKYGFASCWTIPLRNQGEQIIGFFSLVSSKQALPANYECELIHLGALYITLLFQFTKNEISQFAEDARTRRLALVASRTTNGVIITDPGGVMTWVNQGIQQLSGYSESELIGFKPGQVLQGPNTDQKTVALMHAAMEAKEGFEVTLINYTKAGKPFWVQVACTPIYRVDGTLEGFISTQVDVTAHRRLVEFNALHAAINQLVTVMDDEVSLLQAICDLAVHHAHLELAWIGQPDDTGRIGFLACSGNAIPYLQDFYISVDPDRPEGQGPTGKTWRTNRPHYSQSFSATPLLKAWQERARQYGLDAAATQPIIRGGRIWAVFSVYHARQGIFDEELRTLLNNLAYDISHALDRIDLQKREKALAENQRRLTEQLYQEKELAQITLDAVSDAVITTDIRGYVISLNPMARKLCGWHAEEPIGHSISEIMSLIDDTTRISVDNPVVEVLKTGQPAKLGLHTLLITHDGNKYHVENSASPIFSPNGSLRGSVLIIRDNTEKFKSQKRLEWQATHDSLTELPNRYALNLHLDQAITQARQTGRYIAIGLLDLDDFKEVNDQYGHELGDQLLRILAKRLRSKMRASDMLARLGGDELVVVFEHIQPDETHKSLESELARLHEAVETSFDIGADIHVDIGMSMGVAIYPVDAEDGDGLLRQADAAMYAAKTSKFTRANWWRHSMMGLSQNSVDDPIDAYGNTASLLLHKAAPCWKALGTEFALLFYKRLRASPGAKRILDLLIPEEFERLKVKQAEHLRLLISPELTQEQHENISGYLGEIHATIGIESSDMMGAIDDYRRQLRDACQKLPWRLDARLALESILQSRLAREIQAQSQGRDRIEQARVMHLAGTEMDLVTWEQTGDFVHYLAMHLFKMPSIRGVAIGRPDARDEFIFEHATGIATDYLKAFEKQNLSTDTDMKPAKIPTWQRAWMSGEMQVCEREMFEIPSEAMQQIAAQQGIRSSVAIPILDSSGHPLMIVVLLGSYSGQFGSTVMRLWLDSLRHVVTPALQRLERGIAKEPINASTRHNYRTLLLEDKMTIMVQPIVTLQTGAIQKLEVLARLWDGDTLLEPGYFLPTYGQQELHILFRKTLHQILDWMVKWDNAGYQVDANLNLPPCVLIAPDCSSWIEKELNEYGLSADRLYLELLETEEDSFDAIRRDAAVTQLAKLGVRLVMDDLGAGYSSLKRLRSLPFHTVKIDQELVKHAAKNPQQTVPFIGSLVQMAQALGLLVVIEGLESQDLVEMAFGLGANYGQGYALSRPFLPELFEKFMDDHQGALNFADPSSELGRLAMSF